MPYIVGSPGGCCDGDGNGGGGNSNIDRQVDPIPITSPVTNGDLFDLSRSYLSTNWIDVVYGNVALDSTQFEAVNGNQIRLLFDDPTVGGENDPVLMRVTYPYQV